MKIYHNPRCSKSREALKILEASDAEFEIVKYLDETPNENELTQLLKKLNISAKELMRTGEDIYKELNLKSVDDEKSLIEFMVKHPKLIQRPIIIKGDKAVIARPPELVKDFI